MTPAAIAVQDSEVDSPVDPALGLGGLLAAARSTLASVVADLDPSRLTGADAADLYGRVVDVERLANAAKTLLAPRIEESGVWREGGHRSPAVMLASLEGVAPGQAQSTLSNGQRLGLLPGTESALRTGVLSGPKLTELTGAGVLAPEREAELLAGAGEAPLHDVRDRCRRSRATSATHDPLAATRRIRKERHFSSWTDREGAYCYEGRDTADRGAQIQSRMRQVTTNLRRERRAAVDDGSGADDGTGDGDGTGEPGRAVRADAFFALVTGRHPDTGVPLRPRSRPVTGPGRPGQDHDPGQDHGPGPGTDLEPDPDTDPDTDPDAADVPDVAASGGAGARPDQEAASDGGSLIDRPPTCSVVVRVDLDALLRGHAEGDECCEIDTQGPIPVPMARDMANDSFLRLVFHRAGDIRAVSHLGRTINRSLRTALVHRDTTCVVPGCGTSWGLEIDHVIPFAEGGPTELDNLALLCHHHHYLKTYEGWVLSRTAPVPTAGPGGGSHSPRPSARSPTSAGTPTRPRRSGSGSGSGNGSGGTSSSGSDGSGGTSGPSSHPVTGRHTGGLTAASPRRSGHRRRRAGRRRCRSRCARGTQPGRRFPRAGSGWG